MKPYETADEKVERVARVLNDALNGALAIEWDELSPRYQRHYRTAAKAVIAELDADA